MEAGMKATRCYCGKITVEIDGVSSTMTCLEFLRTFAFQPIPPRTERYCPVCSPEQAEKPSSDPVPESAFPVPESTLETSEAATRVV
jgi:hypothetical protein